MNGASYRVEAGTSVFLSISDFNHRVSAELEQESQAFSCVEEWNSACLVRCFWGDRPLVELYMEPVAFPDYATGVTVPLRVVTSSAGLHTKKCPGIGTFLVWTGKSVYFGMWHDTGGFLWNFSV